MGTAFFAVIAVGSSVAATYLATKYFGIVKRFKPILSLDEEAARLRNEIDHNRSEAALEIEQSKADAAETVRAAKSKAADLSKSYTQAKEIYDRLQHEISLLQEDSEDLSFGLYKPHYAFDRAEEYKTALEKVYADKKALIRNDLAAFYSKEWTVNNSKREGLRMTKHQVKLMLRAFNGECDAAVAKVTWNNATRMEERILKSFDAINTLGEVNKVSITPTYRDACLAELRLTHEYELKKQQEKEEQREIKEQMREEERAQREFEKAQREAALERDNAEKALASAREELKKASGEHLDAIQANILDLEQRIADAQAKQDHAVSMAQVTKLGHVYVISNVGSFGEGVFKIGLTRRLDPEDRIQELSGAAVPFGFDVHAMIFSDDAPALELAFHQKFTANRLNLMNPRKEYFRASLDEIVSFAESQGVKVEFTKIAEARQYRESEAMRLRALQQGELAKPTEDAFPAAVLLGVDED
ncbi:MAG: DUF4041 domain-containing protein [Terracidiphilus sp.]